MKMTLFLVFLFLQLTTSASLGDGVGNGGGISENNFVFAYYNIGEFIKYAQEKNLKDLRGAEIEVLSSISGSLEEEYKLKKPLYFLSGRKYPDIFIYPFKEVRIAVTGSRIGTPIYINTDLLYKKVNGQVQYITIPQAVSVIVHELGHHHGISDELFLNTLGAKVSKSIYQKSELRKLREAQNIYQEYLNLGKDSLPQTLISDSDSFFDLGSSLKNKLECPDQSSELLGAEIWQSHWTRRGYPTWYLENEMILYCKGYKPITNVSFLVVPEFVQKENSIRIKKVETYLKRCNPRRSACMAKQAEALEFIKNNKKK